MACPGAPHYTKLTDRFGPVEVPAGARGALPGLTYNSARDPLLSAAARMFRILPKRNTGSAEVAWTTDSSASIPIAAQQFERAELLRCGVIVTVPGARRLFVLKADHSVQTLDRGQRFLLGSFAHHGIGCEMDDGAAWRIDVSGAALLGSRLVEK